MTKGTCFGGVIYLPVHPDADLHGLVRACMRISGWSGLFAQLERLGLPRTPGRMANSQIWQVSWSLAEINATEHHYGELLVCSLTKQYLDQANYRPFGKMPKTARAASGIVPKEF